MENNFENNVEFSRSDKIFHFDEPENKLEFTTQTIKTYTPDEYVSDYYVKIYASELKKIRLKLEKHKKSKFPISEILLSISGISIGAIFSAVFSGQEIALYVYPILFSVACITGTAFFFVRHQNNINVTVLANEILASIPNPNIKNK